VPPGRTGGQARGLLHPNRFFDHIPLYFNKFPFVEKVMLVWITPNGMNSRRFPQPSIWIGRHSSKSGWHHYSQGVFDDWIWLLCSLFTHKMGPAISEYKQVNEEEFLYSI